MWSFCNIIYNNRGILTDTPIVVDTPHILLILAHELRTSEVERYTRI